MSNSWGLTVWIVGIANTEPLLARKPTPHPRLFEENVMATIRILALAVLTTAATAHVPHVIFDGDYLMQSFGWSYIRLLQSFRWSYTQLMQSFRWSYIHLMQSFRWSEIHLIQSFRWSHATIFVAKQTQIYRLD